MKNETEPLNPDGSAIASEDETSKITAEQDGKSIQIAFTPAVPQSVEGLMAPTTSVTGATEVNAGICRVGDYSKHTDDELHQVNLDNLAEFDRLRRSVETHAYEKLLPALNETIARYKRQGCRMGGKSEVAQYLSSLGYNYATIRKWNERFRNSLLATTQPTKSTERGPLPPEQQEVVQALTGQGYKKAEAVVLAKAAKGTTFQERFKSVLAGPVSSTKGVSQSSNDASVKAPAAHVESPQTPVVHDSVPAPDIIEEQELAFNHVEDPLPFKKTLTSTPPLPKPGDWSSLAASISSMCGEHITAALEGLEPEMMVDVFNKCSQRLSQRYCHHTDLNALDNLTRRPTTTAKGSAQELGDVA